MDQINLIGNIGNISADGYKLLKGAATHAVYSHENGRILLCKNGGTLEISDDDLKRISALRGVVSPTSSPIEVSTIIHDLLVDSLLPTTEYNDIEIARRAPVFLSAFDAITSASWRTTTPSSKALPSVVDPGEHAENSGNAFVSPATVYLLQRFPNLRFEWNIDHTGHELKALCNSASPFTIKTPWSAYLRAGYGAINTNPLVSCGSSLDTIIVIDGRPLISRRQFLVERIIAPEHVVPQRLPRFSPDGKHHGAIGAKISDLVRQSNETMSSLLALSALLASVNPLLAAVLPRGYNFVQIAISALGSLCAMLGMVVMTLSKIIAILDGTGALLGLEKAEDARVSEAEILGGAADADLDVGQELWKRIKELPSIGSILPGKLKSS